jgi:hypothetical protein
VIIMFFILLILIFYHKKIFCQGKSTNLTSQWFVTHPQFGSSFKTDDRESKKFENSVPGTILTSACFLSLFGLFLFSPKDKTIPTHSLP